MCIRDRVDYEDRNDRRNADFVEQCVENFLEGEPIIAPEDELELVQALDKMCIRDRLHPVYTGASFRPRKYSDIPATQMLSVYAEEQATFAIGGNRLEIEAGVRGCLLYTSRCV